MKTPDELLAGEINLGPKQAEFGASVWGRLLRACFATLLAVLGGIILVRLITMITEGEWENLSEGVFVLFLILGCAAALLWSARNAGRIRVEVYADGLVHRVGSSTHTCRWEDILVVTEIRLGFADFHEGLHGVMTHQTHAFHLHLRSGQVIALQDYISGLTRLGYMIKEATLPRLVAASLSDLDQGRPINFGPITLYPDGMEVKGKRLAWEEIKRVKRKGNWLFLHRRGALIFWKRLPLGEIPNAHVLEEILAQRSGPQTGQ